MEEMVAHFLSYIVFLPYLCTRISTYNLFKLYGNEKNSYDIGILRHGAHGTGRLDIRHSLFLR